LYVSAATTLVALFIFGLVKGKWMGIRHIWSSAFQTMLVGAIAAACAFFFAKLVPQEH
jgi:VIT1/CCC1 family predicted Fe2+/Mn2+ transporter